MEYDAAIHSIQCPKCQHGMEEVTHGEITIDRCTHCKGLWFDEDEAHHLKALEDSHVLDIGDAEDRLEVGQSRRYQLPALWQGDG